MPSRETPLSLCGHSQPNCAKNENVNGLCGFSAIPGLNHSETKSHVEVPHPPKGSFTIGLTPLPLAAA